MNYVQTITRWLAALAMLTTHVFAKSDVDFLSTSLGEVSVADRIAEQTKKRNKQLSSQIIADMQFILRSAAADQAIEAVHFHARCRLREKNAHLAFASFVALNHTMFSKWSAVYADFMQELLRTMSLGDILENLGLNASTLGVVPTTHRSTPIISKEDDAAKDKAITGIFQRGKNALASLLAFGIGSLSAIISKVQKQAQQLVKEPAVTTEELLQAALRTALKKNLTLTELNALHAFSQTIAFDALVSIAPELQGLFISTLLEDQMVADKLITYHAMATSMAEESEAE